MSQDKFDDPAEVDFSGGKRGRFFRADGVIVPPVYLELDVIHALQARAAKEGVSLDVLANQLLRQYLELAQS
ncbi:MAG: hypothetical protein ACOYKM_13055 [Caulobacterales bacterium]